MSAQSWCHLLTLNIGQTKCQLTQMMLYVRGPDANAPHPNMWASPRVTTESPQDWNQLSASRFVSQDLDTAALWAKCCSMHASNVTMLLHFFITARSVFSVWALWHMLISSKQIKAKATGNVLKQSFAKRKHLKMMMAEQKKGRNQELLQSTVGLDEMIANVSPTVALELKSGDQQSQQTSSSGGH